ncbi:hypothetical protein [Gordonia malaquae]|uniref:hypothetical protein n=1 Tax=Gordonia malaquae TaxID=410332 RepID=UPI00301B283F
MKVFASNVTEAEQKALSLGGKDYLCQATLQSITEVEQEAHRLVPAMKQCDILRAAVEIVARETGHDLYNVTALADRLEAEQTAAVR